MHLMNIFLIFTGCGLGGVSRYGVANGIYAFMGRDFPYGTLVVNVSGSLIMGILFALFTERVADMGPALRSFFLIGFLGGYTTFSSFSIETILLIENGNILSALLNILFSVTLCLGAAWIGFIVGRQ